MSPALDTGDNDPDASVASDTQEAPQEALPTRGARASRHLGARTPSDDPQALVTPKTPSNDGVLKDFARQTWISALEIPSATLGIASFVANQMGADPDTVAHIDQQRHRVEAYAADQTSKLSEASQEAMKSSVFGGTDAEGNPVKGPLDVGLGRYMSTLASSLVPQIALALIPGGIAEAVGTKLATTAVGMGARMAATGAAFGVVDAGTAYNAMADGLTNATHAQLMESPAGAELIKQGMSDPDVIKSLLKSIAPGYVAGHFAAGAAAGVGLGAVTGGAGTTAARGIVRAGVGAAEAGGTMGGQAAADEALDQKARQAMGTQKDFDPGAVAIAAAKGFIGGAVLGAGASVLHGKPADLAKPTRAVEGVAPDHVAAIDMANPPAPPPKTGEPGQAEMFPPHEMDPNAPQPAGPPVPEPQRPPGVQAAEDQGNLFPQGPDPNAARAPDTAPPAEPAPVPAPVPAPADAAPPAAAAPAAPPEAQAKPPTPAAEAPVPTVVTPEPAASTLTRPQLIAALVELGEPKKGLAGLKLTDLRDRLETAKNKAGETPAAPGETPAAPGETPTTPGETPAPVAAPGEPAGKVAAGASFAERVAQAKAARAAPASEPVKAGAPGAVIEPVAPTAGGPVPKAPAPGAGEIKPEASAPVKLSKRELEKQRMAAGGEVPKAKAYVAPDIETVAEPATPPKTHQQALAEMNDAFNTVKSTLKPIKVNDEASMKRAIANAISDLNQHVSSAQRSPAGVIDAVDKWGNQKGPIPGTTTPRIEMADKMMRLLAKREVDTPFRREARQEGRGRSVMEVEGTAREEIEHERDAVGGHAETETDPRVAREKGEEGEKGEPDTKVAEGRTEDAHESGEHAGGDESEGHIDTQTYAGASVPEKVYAPTTDQVRVVERLHDKVLDGSLSPAQADAAYGNGKDRKFVSYDAYLKDQVDKYSNPRAMENIIADMHTNEKDKTTSSQQKSADSVRFNKELKRTDPEHIQHLNDLRAELADPVGTGINRALLRERQSSGRVEPTQDGIPAASSRYVRMNADPRVNYAVSRGLVQATTLNRPYRARELLRDILNSGLIKDELRPLHELAQRFLNKAPDLEVMTPRSAERRGLLRPEDLGQGSSYLGAAMRDANGTPTHILLRADMGDGASQHIETALHEILHSITAPYLDQQIKFNGPAARALTAIGDELRRLVPKNSDLNRLGIDPTVVDHATLNLHELHNMLMTNPSLQVLLSRLPAGDAFRAEMTRLGYPMRPAGTGLWRAFSDWVRRAVGMNPSRSGSETTMLDHILRPTQDIVDLAARYNRSVPDPVVRSMGEPLLRSSGGRLQPLGDAISKVIDPATMGDMTDRAVLQTSSLDNIVRFHERSFRPSDHLVMKNNPLLDYRTSTEATAYTNKQFHDRYLDRTSRAAAGLEGEQGKVIGSLMNDTTLAKAHLGVDPSENAHLTTPEQKATLAELNARYKALTPEGRAAYGEVRDLQKAWTAGERFAALKSIAKQAMPDITDAEQSALARTLATKKSTEAFLKSSDTSPLAAEFGARWETNNALVRAIAKFHAPGFVEGDYFPQRREGDYIVRYGSKETGDYGVETFPRLGDARARSAELEKAGVADVYQADRKRESSMRDILPNHPVIDELFNAMNQRPETAGHAAATRDMLTTIALQHATHSEAARAQLRRKGIVGASTDARKILGQEFLVSGARLGYLTHGADTRAAITQMKLVADDLSRHGGAGDAVTARAVTSELERRIATVDDAASVLAGVARKVTNLGYIKSLMSFSHMVTSSLETHMNSTTFLGARHGAIKTVAALSRALGTLTPRMITTGLGGTLRAGKSLLGMGEGLKSADWNMAHFARDQFIKAGANKTAMTALFNAADRAGLIDHTVETEMRRMVNPGLLGDRVSSMWQSFMDMNAIGAHTVDVMNKSAVLKAAYDLELTKKNATDETARAYAVEMLRRVTPNYNVGNKPRIATNKGVLQGLAAPVMQFKMYGLHMYGALGNLVHESIKGATPEERIEARKAFAGTLATHALMAGSLTLIADPLRYIGGLYDWITGAAKPHAYQNDVRGWMADVMGPELAEIAARGLPHALGFDIHRRVGIANMLELPDLESFDSKGIVKMLGMALTGAGEQDAATMVGGLTKMIHGDLLGGTEDLAPRVVTDVMKAIRIGDKGLVDARGATTLPAEKIGVGSMIAQGLGFQPTVVSEFREGRAAVQEARQEEQTERGQITKAWLQAAPMDRAEIMIAVREFNMKHPADHITTDQLLRLAQNERTLARKPGSFGLHLPAKQAAGLSQAGRFAASP